MFQWITFLSIVFPHVNKYTFHLWHFPRSIYSNIIFAHVTVSAFRFYANIISMYSRVCESSYHESLCYDSFSHLSVLTLICPYLHPLVHTYAQLSVYTHLSAYAHLPVLLPIWYCPFVQTYTPEFRTKNKHWVWASVFFSCNYQQIFENLWVNQNRPRVVFKICG